MVTKVALLSMLMVALVSSVLLLSCQGAWPAGRQRPGPQTRQEVISSLRAHLEWFGVDTAGLSDDELERRLVAGCKELSKLGATAEDVQRLAQVLADIGEKSNETLSKERGDAYLHANQRR